MYARTWRDRYGVSQNEQHLQKARDLYLQAFKATPRDYYTGINAAANSVLLGDLDLAASLASQVEKLLGTTPKPGDYSKNATMAEVQLLKQDYAKAAELYRKAVSDAPEQIGSHRTTFEQVQRSLRHLKPADEERQEFEKVFRHLDL